MIAYYNPFTICYHTLLVIHLAFRGRGGEEAAANSSLPPDKRPSRSGPG